MKLFGRVHDDVISTVKMTSSRTLEIWSHLCSCVLSCGDTCSEDRNWIIRGSKFSISCSSVLSARRDPSLIGVEMSVRAGGEKGNLHQPLSLYSNYTAIRQKSKHAWTKGHKCLQHSVHKILGRGGGSLISEHIRQVLVSS